MADRSATPLVSIVMSAYNADRFLAAALDSALAQTYDSLEIVVVDDGSTDGTPALLERYRRDHGIRVLTQSNRGQSAALNRGWAEARGAWIKFFDADDLLSADAVAAQVAALHGKPRHLAYGVWARFYDDPATARFTPHPGWHHADDPRDWIVETWRDTEPMYQCALFLIPRPLLESAGGWDERLTLINDFEFFTRLALASAGLAFTPTARVYYRSGLAGSVSRSKTHRAWTSACLSTELGVAHLLGREDSPRTRQVAANLLQAQVYNVYPQYPDLYRPLLARIAALGGATVLPGGGPGFRRLVRLAGWRWPVRLRRLLGRQPR